MSLEYLENLEILIESGKEFFVCQGVQSSEWTLANSVESLVKSAQRAANSRKYPVNIYRLVNRWEAGVQDSYLVVSKILSTSPNGIPKIHWTIVDTKEAAELLRDVSQGPSPYFGATLELIVSPMSEKDKNIAKPKKS